MYPTKYTKDCVATSIVSLRFLLLNLDDMYPPINPIAMRLKKNATVLLDITTVDHLVSSAAPLVISSCSNDAATAPTPKSMLDIIRIQLRTSLLN